MSVQILTPESEEQWLGWRAENINSTESAALFELSPYLTAFELYHIKTGNIDDGFTETERTKAGKHMESSIAEFAAAELGLEVEPFKDYVVDTELRMGSSFDYVVKSGKYKGWIMEIKNVDFMVYRSEWEEDEAPAHIEVQVQHQMELVGAPGTIIVALVGGNKLKHIFRERDEEMGRGIRNAIMMFWQGVASGMEPAPDFAKDSDMVIKMHQHAGHETLDAREDTVINSMLEEYDQLSQVAKAAEEAKHAKKAEILDHVGDKYLKVVGEDYTLSCSMTKDTEPTLITEAMVGTTFGGRKGYRMFRLNKPKKKETKKETVQ